jgi:hypothetical protein
MNIPSLPKIHESLLKIELLISFIFNKSMYSCMPVCLHREYDQLYFDIYDTSTKYNVLIFYYGKTVRHDVKTYLKTVVNLNVRYIK